MNKLPAPNMLAAAFLVLVAAFSSQSFAKPAIYTGYFSNVALSGYDTVAYFNAGKPVKGNKHYSTQYMDTQWHFNSQENLNAFIATPEKYAPQYGGYCAWAVANNSTA